MPKRTRFWAHGQGRIDVFESNGHANHSGLSGTADDHRSRTAHRLGWVLVVGSQLGVWATILGGVANPLRFMLLGLFGVAGIFIVIRTSTD